MNDANVRGLQIIKSNLLPIPIASKKAFFKEYRKAICLLLAHEKLKPVQRFSTTAWRVAWISDQKSTVRLEPALLEFEGLSLDKIVFIEAKNIAAAFLGVTEDSFFSAIVVESEPTPACLALARKWLKPASSGNAIVKASDLEKISSEKLVLFLT